MRTVPALLSEPTHKKVIAWALLAGTLLSACDPSNPSNPSDPSNPQGGENASNNTPWVHPFFEGTDKYKDVTQGEGLKLEEAQRLIRKKIYEMKPGMNPNAQFPVCERTPSEMWDRLHLQWYSVTEGVLMFESFLICKKKVFHFGWGDGGSGVMSVAVTDLDGNDKPELLFSYSWGMSFPRKSGQSLLSV